MKIKLGLLLLFPLMANAQFWTEKPSAFEEVSRGINDISIASENVIWATAYDGSGNGDDIQEYTLSIDGGESWEYGDISIGNSGLGIAQIFGVSSDVAYVVAYPQAAGQTGGIFVTENGGSSWTRQNTAEYDNSSSFSNVVHFWDENNGFTQGDPVDGYFELYTTTDGGTAWTRVPEANIPANLSGEYGYVGQIFSAGNRIWFTTNKGRIYRSDDKGNNFEVFQSPISDFAGENEQATLSFTNENSGLLLSTLGNIWRTNNGGETWESFTPNGTLFTNEIFCVPNTSQVISTSVNTTNGAGSSYSLDGGVNWTTIDTIQHTNALAFYNSSVGFSGGFNTSEIEGGMFKYTGAALSTKELENKQIATISPKIVTENLLLEGNNTILKAEIFNSKGQLVKQENINSVSKELELNNLKSGVYFIKIHTLNNSYVFDKFIKQ